MRTEALGIAITQIGVTEEPKGSNSGPEVNNYLASVGLVPGFAWCQALVYWCYQKAAAAVSVLAVDAVANPVVKTAGVLDCWNRTKSSRKIMAVEAKQRPELVSPGDQFILKIGNKGAGHTGIVEKMDGQVMHTIEGNSNDDGSREGYEVVRHVRHVTDSNLLGFIRYE